MCGHQNEPQGLHWLHQQVTVHPSVAMYTCRQPGCKKLVMHEVVHITDDLKHDAHIERISELELLKYYGKTILQYVK